MQEIFDIELISIGLSLKTRAGNVKKILIGLS